MTLTIDYQVDEKKIAEEVREHVLDLIHDTIYENLEYVSIDPSCLSCGQYYKIETAVIKALYEKLMNEED